VTDAPGPIVVVGLMGSGKTTIGRTLAERLGRPFRDSDGDLLARTGRSARDIAAADGVDALHALELEHLLTALSEPEPAVIAAAASVIDEPAGRAALAAPGVRVVWLRVDPDTAEGRTSGPDHRPEHEALAAQAARRDPWFAAVADVVEDVAVADAASIVARLQAWATRAGAPSSSAPSPVAPPDRARR
jgi:shikimate kinase